MLNYLEIGMINKSINLHHHCSLDYIKKGNLRLCKNFLVRFILHIFENLLVIVENL